MELSIVALVIAAVALWWTHEPDVKGKPGPNQIKNKPPSHTVRDLVTSDERIKAI